MIEGGDGWNLYVCRNNPVMVDRWDGGIVG